VSKTCTPCEVGKFKNSTGDENCTACPDVGTSTSTTGSTSMAACKCLPGFGGSGVGSTAGCQQCSAGKFKRSQGTGYCQACASGSFSHVASSACRLCPAGAFSAEKGASACSNCTGGYYQSDLGSTSCVECPQGTFSSSGTAEGQTRDICTKCMGGKKSLATAATNSSACVECEAGSYSEPGSTSCYACPVGKYAKSPTAAGISPTDCEHCAAGKYSSEVKATNSSVCTECQAGSFALRLGQTACLDCGKGTYAISGTQKGQSYDVCTSCTAGKYSSALRALSESTCASCPLNISTTLGVASTSILNCTGVCGAGKYSLRINTTICLLCPVGKYKEGTNHLSVTQCASCRPGSYNRALGATACSSCEAGTYIGEAGRTECLDCDAGTYSAAFSPNCSSCHGLATSPVGSSMADCLCNEGYAGDGVSNCYKCDTEDWRPGTCPCKANYYGDPRNYGGCTRCPDNSFSPEGSYYGSDCVCEAGYYRLEEFNWGTYTYTYSCSQCPTNSMSLEGSTSEYECTCLAGNRYKQARAQAADEIEYARSYVHIRKVTESICRILRELGRTREDVRGLPIAIDVGAWPCL
jgi:hypothetical protein